LTRRTAATSATSTTTTTDATRFALVIGIGKYDPCRLANLPTSEADVNFTQASLQSAGFNVTSLLNEKADRTKILTKIPKIAKQAVDATRSAQGQEGNPCFLFYFVGHQVEIEDEVYLVPYHELDSDETSNVCPDCIAFAWDYWDV
jgi:uncharacterized caspase-like protein